MKKHHSNTQNRASRSTRRRIAPRANTRSRVSKRLFSRVVVLDAGRLVEDGSPAALLGVSDGHVHALFAQAPPRMQATVRRMAALHRSRGLAAVRGLWTSANLQSPARHARAAGAAEAAAHPRPGEGGSAAAPCALGGASSPSLAPASHDAHALASDGAPRERSPTSHRSFPLAAASIACLRKEPRASTISGRSLNLSICF